jgi:hypothetical protein
MRLRFNFRSVRRTTVRICVGCTVAVSLIAVTACTNAVREPVLLDNAEHDTSIMTLEQYVGPDGTTTNPRIVKIFMVHGMTHSAPDWADPFIEQFGDRLGVSIHKCSKDRLVTIPTPMPPQLQPPSTPLPSLPSTRLCIVTSPPIKSGTIIYEFFVLQWSPLTDAYKCTNGLENDREEKDPISTNYYNLPTSVPVCPQGADYFYPRRRASINGPYIKDLVMNDGFPDVVLYLAPSFGPVIRNAVTQALCIMFAFPPAIDPASRGLPAPPSPPCESLPPAHDSDRFVFITHSLGASVLLDTLCDLLPCTEPQPPRGVPVEPSDRLQAEAARRAQPLLATFAQSPPFYMLANQYLLLGLHKADPIQDLPSANLGRIFDIRQHPLFTHVPSAIKKGRSMALIGGNENTPPPQIDVIAFSDPNDDLSFILPEFPNPPVVSPPNTPVHVRNVLVTNSTEWVGTFESPGAAHLNYYKDPGGAGILDVIFCGMSNRKANTCSVRQ